ncbi:MAG: tyrosine-type recombinase/integrase [Bacteroides sp.]|nr:tyrosine-type recombinase/integrase [Bacteroides sp.]
MKVEPIRRVKDVRAIRRLLENSPREYCLFVIGISTNLRASDILQLTIGQVKNVRTGGEVELIEKKTKKRRRITFNDDVVKSVQNLLAMYDDKYSANDALFQGQRGPMTSKTVTRLVKDWCDAINLDGNYGSHSLRKTFGFHQRTRFGTSIVVLMEMYNHSTQKQTMDYLCVQPEEVKDAYLKIAY